MSEFQIEESPTDATSSLKFAPNSSQFLLASSWDRNVRLYDIDNNKLKASYEHELAVLDCCFFDSSHSFSGGLDKTLKMYDWQAQKETV